MKILITLREASERCDFIDLSTALKTPVDELDKLDDTEILILSEKDAETLGLINNSDPLDVG